MNYALVHDLPSCGAKRYGINEVGTAIRNNELGLGVGNGRRNLRYWRELTTYTMI